MALHTTTAALKLTTQLTRELSCCRHMYHLANAESVQAAWQFVSVRHHSTAVKLGYYCHLALDDKLEPAPYTQNKPFCRGTLTCLNRSVLL